MEKDRGFKIIAVVALLIAVVGLSIAYAGYTATLTIDGTATVAGNTWKIQWTTPTGTKTGLASIDGATFAVNSTNQAVSGTLGKLVAPGDSITWSWTAKNDGQIPAEVTGVTLGSLSCTGGTGTEASDVCADLTLAITYDGTALTSAVPSSNELAAGASKNVTLTLTWKSDSTAKVSSDVTVTVGTTSFTYEQA